MTLGILLTFHGNFIEIQCVLGYDLQANGPDAMFAAGMSAGMEANFKNSAFMMEMF